MARIGMNPNRPMQASRLEDVVLCVLTHLPNFEGYHARRFEVVQACIRSMTEHADMPFSLAIWDNGSCREFREWLRDEVKPDILTESVNLGKATGRTALTRILPPGKIVGFCDDDMYFYPNWLSPQVELLRNFPNVSAVTGYAVRTSFRWGNDNTKEWARSTNGAKLETGRFLPDEWERDFAVSIGRDPDQHLRDTANDTDARITYGGRQAYATAHHCQFIGKSEVLSRVVQFDGYAMSDERPFDITLDTIGLRLATTQRLCRHIGNVIHDELRKEIQLIER